MANLIVEKSVHIHAPVAKVWEVLTKPEFIRKWDDLPQDFGDEPLEKGDAIEWMIGGKVTTLTVTALDSQKLLRMALHNSDWSEEIAHDEIGYLYVLSDVHGDTELEIIIGDFEKLADAQSYHDASVEFAETAAQKIKELAEK